MKLRKVGSNQSVLETNQATVFFSYETPVVVVAGGKFFKTDQHFSLTTSKHIKSFLKGVKAEAVPQSFIESFLDEGRTN